MSEFSGTGVTLFHGPVPSDPRGPGVLVNNLTSGLANVGAAFRSMSSYDANAFSSGWMPGVHLYGSLQHVGNMEGMPDNTVVGPNLFVTPDQWDPTLVQKFKHYVVPSQWVHDLYRTYPQLDHATIDVWSVGIDTERWKVSPIHKNRDCFIYFKNRSTQDLDVLEMFLQKLGVVYDVLKYGEYTEDELYHMCLTSRFAVLLTGTESQGIGYMQILSTGLPCYVFDKWYWDNEGQLATKHPATSVPYFSPECGRIMRTMEKDDFLSFMDELPSFNSRKYIEDNHTLEIGARKYCEILKKYQGA